MKKATAVSMMASVMFVLVLLAGCGGGGGGGVAVDNPNRTNTVDLVAQAMRTADSSWSTGSASAKAGETVKMRVKVTNGTAETFKPKVIVALPSSLAFVSGSGKFYKTETSGKSDIPNEIASEDGAELTQEVSADTYNFVEFQATIAENAINGAKTVTVKIVDGQTYTVNITVNVTDGTIPSTTGGTITVTSNKATWVTVNGSRHQITTDGGTITLSNKPAGNYPFFCDAIGMNTVVASPSSNTLTDGGSISFSCTYTSTVGQTGTIYATSNKITTFSLVASDGQTYSGNITTDGGTTNIVIPSGNFTNFTCGSLTGQSLVVSQNSGSVTTGGSISLGCIYMANSNPQPTTGTITVASNEPTWVTVGGSEYQITGSSLTLPNMPAGNYPFTCRAKDGKTVSATPASGSLTGGGALSFSCTYTASASPPATNGTVQVRSNLNVANSVVTCNGSPYSHYMDDLGGVYGYNATMPAGSCTLTCPDVSGKVIDPGASVLSGTLTANGSLTLNCAYGTGGVVGPGNPF